MKISKKHFSDLIAAARKYSDWSYRIGRDFGPEWDVPDGSALIDWFYGFISDICGQEGTTLLDDFLCTGTASLDILNNNRMIINTSEKFASFLIEAAEMIEKIKEEK